MKRMWKILIFVIAGIAVAVGASILIINKTNVSGQILVENDGEYLKWKYTSDEEWNNLISINTLMGQDGEAGINGEKLEIKKEDGYIKWKYEDNNEWTNLVSLDLLTGGKGTDGQDGKEIELQKTDTHIQWKYTSDIEWNNLVDLNDIKGVPGVSGEDGENGLSGIAWVDLGVVDTASLAATCSNDGNSRDAKGYLCYPDSFLQMGNYKYFDNEDHYQWLVTVLRADYEDGSYSVYQTRWSNEDDTNYHRVINYDSSNEELFYNDWEKEVEMSDISKKVYKDLGQIDTESLVCYYPGTQTRKPGAQCYIDKLYEEGFYRFRDNLDEFEFVVSTEVSKNGEWAMYYQTYLSPEGRTKYYRFGEGRIDTQPDWSDWVELGHVRNTIEMRVDSGYIQWKTVYDSTWNNLIAIEDLTGESGESWIDLGIISSENELGEYIIATQFMETIVDEGKYKFKMDDEIFDYHLTVERNEDQDGNILIYQKYRSTEEMIVEYIRTGTYNLGEEVWHWTDYNHYIFWNDALTTFSNINHSHTIYYGVVDTASLEGTCNDSEGNPDIGFKCYINLLTKEGNYVFTDNEDFFQYHVAVEVSTDSNYIYVQQEYWSTEESGARYYRDGYQLKNSGKWYWQKWDYYPNSDMMKEIFAAKDHDHTIDLGIVDTESLIPTCKDKLGRPNNTYFCYMDQLTEEGNYIFTDNEDFFQYHVKTERSETGAGIYIQQEYWSTEEIGARYYRSGYNYKNPDKWYWLDWAYYPNATEIEILFAAKDHDHITDLGKIDIESKVQTCYDSYGNERYLSTCYLDTLINEGKYKYWESYDGFYWYVEVKELDGSEYYDEEPYKFLYQTYWTSENKSYFRYGVCNMNNKTCNWGNFSSLGLSGRTKTTDTTITVFLQNFYDAEDMDNDLHYAEYFVTANNNTNPTNYNVKHYYDPTTHKLTQEYFEISKPEKVYRRIGEIPEVGHGPTNWGEWYTLDYSKSQVSDSNVINLGIVDTDSYHETCLDGYGEPGIGYYCYMQELTEEGEYQFTDNEDYFIWRVKVERVEGAAESWQEGIIYVRQVYWCSEEGGNVSYSVNGTYQDGEWTWNPANRLEAIN